MVKNVPANAEGKRDMGLIPGSGRPLEEDMASLQYYWLENPVDREAWWATVHGAANWTQLSI